MRAPIVLMCGLAAAAAALLALRGGGDPQQARPVPVAPAPASAAVPSPASAAAPAVNSPLELPVPAARPPEAASLASRTPVAPLAAKPALPASPVRSTFALSSDHQALILGTALAAGDHELLEHEPRDDPWATESEQLIRQALARHGGAVSFDIIAVDCRRTLCAIQAFSNGENGHREWVAALDQLYRETLAGVFDSVNTAFPPQGGRSPVLTFLHRRSAGQKP